jgi:ADP-heptose:LPS heptosyltransferase
MPEQRFVVVRLGSLGDIVHTFPAVAALRESFPNAEIVWITHPRWESLVESSGMASEIWPVDSRVLHSVGQTIRRIWRSPWDAAIDYQGLWKSALLPFLGGVQRRIGFSSKTIREFGVPILYTDSVECAAVHIAQQNGELSRRAGARNLTAPFHLRIAEAHQAEVRSYLQRAGIARYIVLSPGGGWRSKCWPPERFGALARLIRNSLGLRCVVNTGPGEDDLAAALRTASGDAEPLFYNAALGPLMALLCNAACIVGGDTGPLHLAIALGTPAVALFGPTDPARNGPYHCGHTAGSTFGDDIVLRAPDGPTSHKRHDRPADSILAIDVDSVFAAVRRRTGAIA